MNILQANYLIWSRGKAKVPKRTKKAWLRHHLRILVCSEGIDVLVEFQLFSQQLMYFSGTRPVINVGTIQQTVVFEKIDIELGPPFTATPESDPLSKRSYLNYKNFVKYKFPLKSCEGNERTCKLHDLGLFYSTASAALYIASALSSIFVFPLSFPREFLRLVCFGF